MKHRPSIVKTRRARKVTWSVPDSPSGSPEAVAEEVPDPSAPVRPGVHPHVEAVTYTRLVSVAYEYLVARGMPVKVAQAHARSVAVQAVSNLNECPARIADGAPGVADETWLNGWACQTLFATDRNRVEVWRCPHHAPFVTKTFTQADEAMRELRVYDVLLRHPHDHLLGLAHMPSFFSYATLYLPLCAGGDLLDLVRRRGHLPEPEALGLVRQVASAVAHLHRHNVAHLDLKLENVFCDAACAQVRVGDYGHAQLLDGDGTCSKRAGTLYYAAPEVFALPASYDGRRADAWSLGVLACCLALGAQPLRPGYVRRAREWPFAPPVADALLARIPLVGRVVRACVVTDPLRRALPLEVEHLIGTLCGAECEEA